MVSSSQWFVSAGFSPDMSCIIALRLWTSASDRPNADTAASAGPGSEADSQGAAGWGSTVIWSVARGPGVENEKEMDGALGLSAATYTIGRFARGCLGQIAWRIKWDGDGMDIIREAASSPRALPPADPPNKAHNMYLKCAGGGAREDIEETLRRLQAVTLLHVHVLAESTLEGLQCSFHLSHEAGSREGTGTRKAGPERQND